MKVLLNFERSDSDPMIYVVSDALKEAGCEIVRTKFPPDKKEDIMKAAIDCEAALVWLDTWDEEAFSRAKKLKLLIRYGAGYDKIDLEAATRHGVAVLTAAGNSLAVAEGTVALMIDVCRNITRMDRNFRKGVWRPTPVSDNLYGKTVGIIGFGRIGRTVAELLKGFHGEILAYDDWISLEAMAELGVRKVSLDELLTQSDIVTCHTPLTEKTKGMVDEAFLKKMKSSAYLINTSRGEVVKEEALLKALRDGTIRGAGLDVFEQEPAAGDNMLFNLENVVVTPHTLSAAWSTYQTTSDLVLEAIKSYQETGEPPWALNPEVLSRNKENVCL